VEILLENIKETLKGVDGILVAPGFGDRGIEGKVLTAKYARENKIPMLGICLGMQIMTIEFARNVLGHTKANSMEFDTSTPDPVISLMEEQKNVVDKGGTMRLGAWKCALKNGSKLNEIYGAKIFLKDTVTDMNSTVIIFRNLKKWFLSYRNKP
jgi:CTP synthase